jgi:2-amino-4-hydroxy-6-hydroxymethyldihydropteridine diphosphokinase
VAKVYVSLGSNIHRYRHITASLEALQQHFGALAISPVYESVSVGFDGSNFLNLVVGFDTALSVGDLSNCLRGIEHDNGRRRDGPRYSPRTLDIDILTYADLAGVIDGIELPREEISQNAFVLLPLAELAGEDIHPLFKQSYQHMWDDYDQASQRLWRVDFSWRGQLVSAAS